MYKMQCLEVSGAVRHIYGSLGVKRLTSAGFKNEWSFSSTPFYPLMSCTGTSFRKTVKFRIVK